MLRLRSFMLISLVAISRLYFIMDDGNMDLASPHNQILVSYRGIVQRALKLLMMVTFRALRASLAKIMHNILANIGCISLYPSSCTAYAYSWRISSH